jgi:hypothetical protein
MTHTAVLTLQAGFHVFMDATWDHSSIDDGTRRSPAPAPDAWPSCGCLECHIQTLKIEMTDEAYIIPVLLYD